MKRIVATFLAILALGAAPVPAPAQTLSGDEKLACEAVMCLTYAGLQAPDKVPECGPSIRRYLSIHESRPHLTFAAQRRFLNSCPFSKTGNDTSEMDAQKQAITSSAFAAAYQAPCTPSDMNEGNLTNDYRVDESGVGHTVAIVSPRLLASCAWNASAYVYNGSAVWSYNGMTIYGRWLHK